jgi:hypothetical protein
MFCQRSGRFTLFVGAFADILVPDVITGYLEMGNVVGVDDRQ